MFASFQKFLREKNLLEPNEKTLLAVSTGIDSMVMLHLFILAKLPFGIIHCNFSLRPEAEEEGIFIKNLAQERQIPFYYRKFDTLTFAQAEGISIQMAARKLRYAFFEEIRQTYQYDYIATAHHLDDSLETALLNLVRGSGIAGLRGILAKKNRLIRPLLFANKQEIIDFAQKENIFWLEDSSNTLTKYKRNFIRKKVIPLLKELNPDLLTSFQRNSSKLQYTEHIYQLYFQKIKKKYIHKENKCIFLNTNHIHSFVALYELLRKYGFTLQQSEQMLASQHSGKDFFSKKYWAVLDRKQIVICPISYQNRPTDIFEVPINASLQTDFFSIETKIIENKNFEYLEKNTHIAYLDYEKLTLPLKIRLWQQGEKFVPFGMKKNKKVSDFLIDAKIPKNIKNRIFVVLSKNEIVYLAGLRSSNEFCVKTQSKLILQIRYQSL
ncbi:MAG: tRNA lysidine(34) synthetase TilS [Thermonemataceae bacterium]|nr:tRNA lysidine(34) synthetase TilS [Thermonemataceae bacterium]